MESIIVDDCLEWRQMTGRTDTIKKLNSLLTWAMILRHGVPADECESEAEAVVQEWERSQSIEAVHSLLVDSFATVTTSQQSEVVEVVPAFLDMLNTIRPIVETILTGGEWEEHSNC